MLEQLGVAFDVRPADVIEEGEGEPHRVARLNAVRKAEAVRALGRVIGCDTIVAVDGDILGKPHDAGEARRFLGRLAGRGHEVISGLAVAEDGKVVAQGDATTKVTFRAVEGGFLDRYVATGEWRGRAGGYAVQGRGAALVEAIEGDYNNVVGLPVALLLTLVPDLLEPTP